MTRIVPRAGLVVIDPLTRKALPAEGADVDIDSYWIRRLRDGDVTEWKAPEAPQEQPAAQPKARKQRHRRG